MSPPKDPSRPKLRAATPEDEPAPAALPPPAPAAPEPAPPPPPALSAPPTEDDYAPLWDDRAEDPKAYMLKHEFLKTHVFRLVVEPGRQQPRRDFTLELPPEATIADLARLRGGGRFHLAAMGPKGQPIGWKVVSIEGPPAQLTAPVMGAATADPIMETAMGMVGVRGLDPMIQFSFALLQGYTAQVREDARFLISSYVQTVANLANAKTPAAAAQHEFVGFLQRQLNDRDAMVDDFRREMSKLSHSVEELRVENHKLKHSRADGGPFNEAISQAVPVIAERVGSTMEKIVDHMTGNKP